MLFVFALTAASYFIFAQTNQFKEFVTWSQSHILIYIVFLITIKIGGVIYPPIPGGIFTLASIPVLGWQTAYVVDFVGSILGGTACYFLGKKFGYQLLEKVFDKEIISKMELLKVKKKKELEAIIVWRLLAGGTVVEAIYYGAGFFRVGLVNFFLGTSISHLIVGIPSFYLGSTIFSSQNIVLNILLIGLSIGTLYIVRGRYFE